MPSNAAMERDITDRASIASFSLNKDATELESESEPEPEVEISAARRQSDLVEELTKTLAEKAGQVHISMTSGMLNPTNPGIDFMQLMQLIEPNSGLSYADDISRQHDERVRQALDLVTTDPTKLDELYLTNLFT